MSDSVVSNETNEVSIPEDLKLKAIAVNSLTSIHALLNSGSFSGSEADRVLMSLQFVKSLHDQMLKEVEAHPQYSHLKKE